MQHQQPRLTAIAFKRLIEPGVLLVVSIRRDGTPRLSPVEPFLLDGDLWLSMLLGSRKASDLLRDPRILVHNIVTSPDGAQGELKLRGTAEHVAGATEQRRYADAVSEVLPWSPQVGQFHLFRIQIQEITYIRYDDTGDQYLVRWPAGTEIVRPLATATSLGPPRPSSGVLV